MELREIGKVLLAIFICELAGIIGSIATYPNIPGWYAGLVKPSFAPPNWLFGPAWITLYALMGIAAYLVWNKGTKKAEVRTALGVFMVQLVLNTLWSFLFFGMRSPLYGLIGISALWLAIVGTIVLFYRISKTTALLLAPYIAWVSFAMALNFYIWQLNP